MSSLVLTPGSVADMGHWRPFPIGSLLLVAIVLVAMLVTYYLVRPPAPPAGLAPVLEREFRPLAAFQLSRHNAAPLTESDLRGQWSLFYFGHLACGEDCAAALRELARFEAARGDDADPRDAPTRVIYVSVDPARDNAERLAEYVAHFDRGFVGATAGQGQIDRLTAQFGVALEVAAASGPERYALDGAIYVVDPFGRHVASFAAPHSAATLRARIGEIIDYFARRGARASPRGESVVALVAAARLAPGPDEIRRDQRDVDDHADDEKADRRVVAGAGGFARGLLARRDQLAAAGYGV